MKILEILLFLNLFCFSYSGYATLAGGRPNTFSKGQNAFAGVVNPANAVWIEDRFDVGASWTYQQSSLNNLDNNSRFLPGKTNLTHKVNNIYSADAALHKLFKAKTGAKINDFSIGIAYYTTPSPVRLRTKEPIPIVGTTPISIYSKVQVVSLIFSYKLGDHHSVGMNLDYFYFSHFRNGFQGADNSLRSVSPGNVTNRGMDHSSGIGLTLGWRWKITKVLDFGIAWTGKAPCGRYRKYRGYEPHHANNYTPQIIGGGFTYLFSSKLAGHLECIWSNFGNLPNSNNSVLPNGQLNRSRRGSNKSPGPGLQDATVINAGIGYVLNSVVSIGMGYSHRIKLHHSSNFLSHSYRRQVIFDILSLGAHFKYGKQDLYLFFANGFNNRVTGKMPEEIGGGRFKSNKRNSTLSISVGRQY